MGYNMPPLFRARFYELSKIIKKLFIFEVRKHIIKLN